MSRRAYKVDATDENRPRVVKRQSMYDPELTFVEARTKAIQILRAKRAELDAEIRQLRAQRESGRPSPETRVFNAELIAARAWANVRQVHAQGRTGPLLTQLLLLEIAEGLGLEWDWDVDLNATMRLVLKQARAVGELHLVDTESGQWPGRGTARRVVRQSTLDEVAAFQERLAGWTVPSSAQEQG